ncbi:PREDICTED: metallo-beta-lactamase domain-containing protein 1-like, partial [Calidris pugnax]|uniref:metallo-beta-lactamase domain-containing protein 1-like n=1 Tax=Calidris pugnax TaxID=198806 RepID=UPI00071CBA5E
CTHGHSDHVGNLNLFPLATLVLGYDVCHGAGCYVPNGLAKGQPYVLDPGHLEVVATPGHTRSHVSLVVRATSLGTVVVAGDLFEREGDEGEGEELSEDPQEQEKSRRRVVAMADVIVPGHGPPFRVIKEGPRESRSRVKKKEISLPPLLQPVTPAPDPGTGAGDEAFGGRFPREAALGPSGHSRRL